MSGNLIDINSEDLAKNGAIFGPFVALKNEWYRIIIAMFLHGGLIHLAMNTISLVIVGRAIEGYFSSKDYIIIYLASGIIGGLASIYFHPLSLIIGASGAIFGIFGALVAFFIVHRKRLLNNFKELMNNVAVILGINLLIGLAFPSIDMSAHISGMIVGFIGGFVASKYNKFMLLYLLLVFLIIVSIYGYLPNLYLKYI
jgi:rhomboid protease GluP